MSRRTVPRPQQGKRGQGVLVLGEALCDLFSATPNTALAAAGTLVPHLGGAPANVAVQLARLGIRSALVGAVGADPMGDRVLSDLQREGVDVSGMRRAQGHRTGVTLVESMGGDRRFFPLVDRRADLALAPHDVVPSHVQTFAAVHTGTVGLKTSSGRAAHRALVTAARRAGCLVSLDVNLRWGMYPSREELLRRARAALQRADVLKATREEAIALVHASPRLGLRALGQRLLDEGPKLVLMTLDADGAIVATQGHSIHVPAPRTNVVDATGAGDAFCGAALAWFISRQITRDDLTMLDADSLSALGAFACRAGSQCCTAVGATTAMIRGDMRVP